jgi:hypothetical protein
MPNNHGKKNYPHALRTRAFTLVQFLLAQCLGLVFIPGPMGQCSFPCLSYELNSSSPNKSMYLVCWYSFWYGDVSLNKDLRLLQNTKCKQMSLPEVPA